MKKEKKKRVLMHDDHIPFATWYSIVRLSFSQASHRLIYDNNVTKTLILYRKQEEH
jgi:hypothetical protein